MPYYVIVGLVAAGILLLCVIYKIVKASRRKGNHVEEIRGVRYTTTSDYTKEATEEDLDVKISYNKGDIVIPANQERKVGKGEDIKPGKYIILSTVEGTDTINIRIGGYVRVYAHASEIILAEGETVCPTNIAVILR